MPTPVVGYNRNELIAQLSDIIGNSSASFVLQAQTNMTAWALQFYSLHDWNYLLKNGVQDNFQFTLINNKSTYLINTATMGYEANATYLESLYVQQAGQQIRLIKQEIQQLRLGDPGQISTGYPNYWFPASEKEIVIWPTPVTGNGAGIVIYIDGKVLGSEISSDPLVNPIIPVPYELQDLFLEWCLCKCMRRERDPRHGEEYQNFEIAKRNAINNDMRNEETNMQVKTVNEQLGSGSPNNLDTLLWYTPNSGY